MAVIPTPEGRCNAFTDLCEQAAGYVAKGAPKPEVVDTLVEIADAHGLTSVYGQDGLQTIISDAFQRAEFDPELLLWKDTPTDAPKQNGKDKHARPAKPKIPIVSVGEFLKGFVAPKYLVTGILQRGFIYSLTGQTGHAKTAVALLIARLIGSRSPNLRLGPHRVRHGRVLYFVGENPDDVRMRMIGMNHLREDHPDEDVIFFIPGVFNLNDMIAALEADCAKAGDIALIIVDTSAAYFLGNEELNNVQMGAHARLLRKLTQLPGHPTVLVLCHPIKHVQEQTQLLPRGGGAYLAEMDGNLTLWRMGEDMVELHHTGKFRGPDFAPVTFRLEPIRDCPKLLDADGNQMNTVQAVAITQKDEDAQNARILTDENKILAALLQLGNVSYSTLAEVIGWVDANGIVQKKRVERLLKRMQAGKPRLVVQNRHGWGLTKAGQEQARAYAIQAENERVARNQLKMEGL